MVSLVVEYTDIDTEDDTPLAIGLDDDAVSSFVDTLDPTKQIAVIPLAGSPWEAFFKATANLLTTSNNIMEFSTNPTRGT